MTEWKEYKFSDFVEINPSVKIPKGIPVSFVEMKDLDSSVRYCEGSQKKELTGGSRFINGDTLFARITPCLENGRICQVRNLKNGYGFGSTEFHVFRGKEGVSDNDFVYYLSRWDEVRDFAEHNLEGSSGRQRVSKEAFDNLFLILPPLPTQRRIASILSSLDDKIDLLHRENATLEQMAETLFRQWFVVEAKEEWEEGQLGDICNYVNEKIDIGNVETGDYISTENMCPNKQGVVLASSVPENGKATKYRIDDVLLSNIRPYFKKIWLSDREGGCSADVLCIRGKNELYAFFSYYTIRQDEFFDYVMLGSKGCKMPRGDKSHIMNWPIIIPPKDELLKFNEIAKQGITKIRNNNKQIRTLIQMRDGLLPRLMSGEVKL
jgi:type I restriction enzyme S subunit